MRPTLGTLRYATARRYYGDRDRAKLGKARRLTRQTQMIKIWAVIRLRPETQTRASAVKILGINITSCRRSSASP